jgi:hypothetical protein
MDALIEEALLLLAEIYPLLAGVYWLYTVEDCTEVELAQRFAVTEKAIRRWLNGYNRHDGQHIWGAKDYLANILDLFLEAHRSNHLEAVTFAFQFARKTNPWGAPFPAALLDTCWQAMDADGLAYFLARLEKARESNTYAQVMRDLLECYHRGQLQCLFAELCPETDEGCARLEQRKEDPSE